MSQKRKLEEFQDPDYPQDNEKRRRTNANLLPVERIEKIRAIIRREFHSELSAKEQEVAEIDSRIQLAKKLLHKVRYAVVADYYSKKNLELTTVETGVNNTAPLPAPEKPNEVQKVIHPALKSLLGKKYVDYDEILRIRPTREAAKTAKTSIKEKLRTKKEEKRLQRELKGILKKDTSAGLGEPKKIPRHVEPVKVEKHVPQINAARGRNQTKHLIVVGNTSKFIGDEKASDKVTHKWLVYVQTKTTVPIEKILYKVRFFLHPSYRPNDIVDISSPPFQLSRRGWGEFPVRVQLFFDAKLQQKPVQVVHNLVLDKTLSGLQTMGAETLVEIWLCSDHLITQLKDTQVSVPTQNIIEEPVKQSNEDEEQIEDNLLAFLNKIEKQNPSICQESDKIEPTIICSPIIDSGIIPPDKILLSPKAEIKIETVSAKNIQDEKLPDLVSSADNIIADNIQKPNSSFNFDIGAEQVVQSTVQNNTLPQCVQNNAGTTPPVPNPPKVFQRKLVKCIDKQGNVKFIPMLVSTNPASTDQILPQPVKINQTSGNPKTFIFTKVNNQTNSTDSKPGQILKLNTGGENILNNKILPTQTVHPMKVGGSKIFFVNNNNNCKVQKIVGSNIPENNSAKLVVANQQNVPKVQTSSENSLGNRLQPQIVTNSPVASQIKLGASNLVNQKIPANINKNHVFMKDGKMFIIDPLQSKIKQQIKKQQSLLKPQISLLKPIVKNDNLSNCIRNNSSQVFNHTALATDHDYTSLVSSRPQTSNTVIINRPLKFISQRSNIVTVNSPNNSPVNVVVTQMKSIPKNLPTVSSKSSGASKPVLMQKPRRDYVKELEQKFLKMCFTGIRHAVEYLLKQLPLVNNLAINSDYKMSYPFIVSSEKIFSSLITPKQKCYEWLRAKYISQLIEKHMDLVSSDPWTTREIILFARHHAFSPVITYVKNTVNKDSNMDNDTLKDLVQREIKKERFNHQTVTPAKEIQDWINSMRIKLQGKLGCVEEVVDVENSDSEEDARVKQLTKLSPIKNLSNKCWMSLGSNLEKESSIISEKCLEIGIRLHPEEILPGIMHPSAQAVLAQALHSFTEDLLRRSLCKKLELDPSSSIMEAILQPDDVKAAILHHPQFDFLTNKDLGVLKVKEEKEVRV